MKMVALELCIETCRAYGASTSPIAAIPDADTVHKCRSSKPKHVQKNINQMSISVISVESNMKC